MLFRVVEENVRGLMISQVEIFNINYLPLRDVSVIEDVPQVRVLVDIPGISDVVSCISIVSNMDNE